MDFSIVNISSSSSCHIVAHRYIMGMRSWCSSEVSSPSTSDCADGRIVHDDRAWVSSRVTFTTLKSSLGNIVLYAYHTRFVEPTDNVHLRLIAIT
jgi:hypothetical protein